jgi:hypothetical protein
VKIFDAFPSKFVKSSDLQGREQIVTIREVKLENLRGGKRPVLYFERRSKGFVINKTNARAIAAMYSEETDAWVGKQMTLYPTMVEFQGKMVESIRIKGPKLRDVA